MEVRINLKRTGNKRVRCYAYYESESEAYERAKRIPQEIPVEEIEKLAIVTYPSRKDNRPYTRKEHILIQK